MGYMTDKQSMGVETSQVVGKVKHLKEICLDNLERGPVERSNKGDDVRAHQSKLIELLQSNAGDLAIKSKQLSAHAATVCVLTGQRGELRNLIWLLQNEPRYKTGQWECCKGRLLKQIRILESNLLSERKKSTTLVQMNDRLISQCDCPALRKYYTLKHDMFSRCSLLDHDEDQTDKLSFAINEVKSDEDDGHVKVKADAVGLVADHINLKYIQKVANCLRSCPSNETEFIATISDSRKGFSPFPLTKKRTASHWIKTRPHPNWSGPDPHDDFLDTPLQSIKVNLNKASTEGSGGFHVNVSTEPKSVRNYETPQKCTDLHPYKHPMTTVYNGNEMFKHVEVVRKKKDRSNLKGIDCGQCKKFYDAFLLDIDIKSGSTHSHVRSKHHHGVSRHRYNYVPPITPEGFWNIGFDSEI